MHSRATLSFKHICSCPLPPALHPSSLSQAWHGYVQTLQTVQSGLTVTVDKAVAAMHLQESLIKYMMSVSGRKSIWRRGGYGVLDTWLS